MNKKILLAIVLIILFASGYLLIDSYNDKKNDKLLNPLFKNVESSSMPTISPSPTPKTFKFERNTDLKMELESINPLVLESDFE